jgi:hypothetical protein
VTGKEVDLVSAREEEDGSGKAPSQLEIVWTRKSGLPGRGAVMRRTVRRVGEEGWRVEKAAEVTAILGEGVTALKASVGRMRRVMKWTKEKERLEGKEEMVDGRARGAMAE